MGICSSCNKDFIDHLGIIGTCKENLELKAKIIKLELGYDTITDGHGNYFPRWCDCGEANGIVRPGKYQCPLCG